LKLNQVQNQNVNAVASNLSNSQFNATGKSSAVGVGAEAGQALKDLPK
jgi:hypothetical protein